MNPSWSHPVLSCAQAADFEAALLGRDEAAEWAAMQRAGAAVAAAIERDFGELGPWPHTPRLLVLAGKGHNAGDALIAAHRLLARSPGARAQVVFAAGERALRPLAARAWCELAETFPQRVETLAAASLASGGASACGCDVLIDGVFGFQFRPPLREPARSLLRAANALPARFRAAVDLPSGLGDADAFRADFTYATGIVKQPLLDPHHAAAAGRVRYLDLGFFDASCDAAARAKPPASAAEHVVTPAILAPLAALRPATSDKRTFGHLLVVAGSRELPGAALMAVLAALRSGVGLVTAFVPESLASAFAARAPEAMWVGWPETPAGGLALEGEHLLRRWAGRATALVAGPGLGREPETLALIASLAGSAPWPVVLDADALQRDTIATARGPLVLTPHAGEYARIAGEVPLAGFARADRIVVAKGAPTRVSDGTHTWHALAGGPVLARGGSGDLLAGLLGGLLAQAPGEPALAALRAVVWHGLAADALARTHGATAVATTQLLDHLAPALREFS